jgi:hypothetical protein
MDWNRVEGNWKQFKGKSTIGADGRNGRLGTKLAKPY